MSARARLSLRLALIGIVTAVAALIAAPFALGAGGTISGTVTDGVGGPIADVCVTAEGEEAEFPTSTDIEGEYTLWVAPGEYIVRFDDCGTSELATEYWDDALEREFATPVPIAADEVRTEVNAVLLPASEDTGAPETEIIEAPPVNITETTAEFVFESNDPGATFQCSLDGIAFASCTGPKLYEELADGDHHFEVRAVDGLGRPDPTPATHDFSIDSAAPETTIADAPRYETVATRSVTFAFESDDPNATFLCQIDDRSGPCSSPHTEGGLDNGPHTFSVRATDPSGNTDQTAATTSFYVNVDGPVDLDPPETTITAGPGAFINTSGTAFRFVSDEPGGFECKLDDGAYGECSSPRILAGLDEGTHTFSVRAIDAAGNADPKPASRTFTYDTSADTIAPDTTITSGPTGTIGQTYATFGFSSSEGGGTFECSIDGGTFTTCTSPRTYNSLSDGPHTFRVRARDAASNVDDTPAERQFTVDPSLGTDTTPPVTSIQSEPPALHGQRSATFAFTSDEGGSRFDCRLDSGAWARCTSPRTLTNLQDGTYTFRVRAVDAAGNFDPTAEVRTFTVDATAPDTLLGEGPDGQRINTTPAEYTFDATESPVTYECRLNAGDWQECENPHQVTGLTEGTHTLAFRAKDAAGNVDGTPVLSGFIVDLTAPNTTIDSGPSGTVRNAGSFTFSADENAFFECRIDGGEWDLCNSPHEVGSLGEGNHTFEVRATDTAGNADDNPASRTFTIDNVGPTTTITGGPSGTINTGSASFSFSANEPGSDFQCRLDAGGWGPCTSPQGYSGLADGSHTFQVRARDAIGNEGAPASRTFAVDTDTTQQPAPPPPPPPPPPPTGPGPECAAAQNKLDSAQAALKKAKTKVKTAKGKAKKKAKAKLKKAKANVKKAQSAMASSC